MLHGASITCMFVALLCDMHDVRSFVTGSAERHGEPATKRGWHHHYYADISPHFGRMTVDEILTEHIQTWVSTHLEKRRIGCGTIEAKIAAAACGARSTRQSQSRNARCSGAS